MEGYSFLTIVKQSPEFYFGKDATTCFRILHSVWIGPFTGSGRFGTFSRLAGSELR